MVRQLKIQLQQEQQRPVTAAAMPATAAATPATAAPAGAAAATPGARASKTKKTNGKATGFRV